MALPFCVRPRGHLQFIPSSCRKLEQSRPERTFLTANYGQFGAIISALADFNRHTKRFPRRTRQIY